MHIQLCRLFTLCHCIYFALRRYWVSIVAVHTVFFCGENNYNQVQSWIFSWTISNFVIQIIWALFGIFGFLKELDLSNAAVSGVFRCVTLFLMFDFWNIVVIKLIIKCLFSKFTLHQIIANYQILNFLLIVDVWQAKWSFTRRWFFRIAPKLAYLIIW